MPVWLVRWEDCGISEVVDADNPFLAVRDCLRGRDPVLEMKPGKSRCCQWVVREVGSDTYFSIRESW